MNDFYCLNEMQVARCAELATENTDKSHKIAFSGFKLKVPKTYAEFKFGDKTVQVLKYLPVQEKEDIIEVAYQKAIVKSSFNPILFNIYFLLNIVYSYANLTFTDEQRKDEKKLYDMLDSSGLLNKIFQAMESTEVTFFYENVNAYVQRRLAEDYSAVGLFNNTVGAFNTFTKIISEKFSNVDEATLQTLIDKLPNLIGGNKIEQVK
jgi:hypothetical protein